MTTVKSSEKRSFRLWLVLLLSLPLGLGCEGGTTDGGTSGDGDIDPAGDGDGDGDGDGGDGDGDGDLAEDPVPQSRFPRLSHEQWERTVGDLFVFEAETDYASTLRSDPNPGGAIFVRHGQLRVDQSLWQGYQRVAEELAEIVAEDAAKLEQLAPDTGDAEARIDTFLRTVGRRVHRRPLTESDVTAYRTLFDAGPGMYPASEGLTPFAAGARVVIEAWLQSPYFLYRPELGTSETEGRIELDDFEMASRLSYALWSTMPDDVLLDAAEAGELSSAGQVALEAERLLADARAERIIEDFHGRLFKTDAYDQLQPPPALGASATFGAALAEEHRLMVTDLYGTGGGLETLLTTRRTFVNAELASVYGLEGTFDDDEHTAVELDEETRRGVLTMAGFSAANAAGGVPDPIHRGVFVSTRLVCNDVPAPPDDIPPYPQSEGQTNRQLIESLTEQPGSNCAGCHTTIINPFGFPFENYDALGRYQTMDNGLPIDASSMLLLGQEEVSVQNGIVLAEALAASAVVHECYAGHWLSFLYGRERDLQGDGAVVGRVGDMSLQSRASLVELIVGLVQSDAFRFRSATEELP